MRYARVRGGEVVNLEEWQPEMLELYRIPAGDELIADENGDAVIGLSYDQETGFELLPEEPEPTWINDPPLIPDDPDPISEDAYIRVLEATINALEKGATR
jgi:hypothetical protein